jgi:hypothetical protein
MDGGGVEKLSRKALQQARDLVARIHVVVVEVPEIGTASASVIHALRLAHDVLAAERILAGPRAGLSILSIDLDVLEVPLTDQPSELRDAGVLAEESRR